MVSIWNYTKSLPGIVILFFYSGLLKAMVFERGMMMKTGFIGAGKVGFSLGKYFSEKGLHVTGYYSRHEEAGREAALFTGTEAYKSPEDLIKKSDAIFLTVPDSEIKKVYDSLDKRLLENKEIIHVSGSLGIDETFDDALDHGIIPISIHPLYPFRDKYESFKGLPGVFFCLEGPDSNALSDWSKRLEDIGLRTKIILSERKAEYHLACAEMSNLICAIAELSIKHMENTGFSREEALLSLKPLFYRNAENIFSNGPSKALSGPVERGDTGTVKKHLRYMDANEKNLYISASKELIKLAREKNPKKDYSELLDFLNKEP